MWEEIIEEDVAVTSAGSEAHVIFIPVDAVDSALMVRELHRVRTLSFVEVENMALFWFCNCSKKMTTMTELDVIASTDSPFFELVELLSSNIEDYNFVS